jgi:hypothetical protein
MAPEVVNQKAAEYAAGGHLAVIRKLVSGDQVGMAQEYFTKIKGELGTNVDEAQTLLKAGQNKAGAQTLSDQVLNEGGTLSEQRAKVKDRAKTADERDQALAYIEHEDALSDRAQRDALELRDRNVHDILDKAKSIKAIPASTWNQMSGNERNEAISYAKRLVEGVDVKTDVRELEKLYRQADEDPDAFTKLRLTELGFANRLSKGDMEEMLRLQHSMRTAGRKAIEKDLAPARTRDQIWTTTIQGAGIKPNTEAASMLQRRFIENVQREQTLRGKELTETEVQEQLDRLLIPVVTAPGFIWDTKKRGYELQANDVPLNDRRRLAQALRNKQQLVDPQTILELWIDEQEAKAK